MPKARPDRIRVTLWDDAAGATPLELPPRRHWPIGLVFAVFFAIFAGIAWVQIIKMSSHEVHRAFRRLHGRAFSVRVRLFRARLRQRHAYVGALQELFSRTIERALWTARVERALADETARNGSGPLR